jgi:hypothetical protein
MHSFRFAGTITVFPPIWKSFISQAQDERSLKAGKRIWAFYELESLVALPFHRLLDSDGQIPAIGKYGNEGLAFK